ncbi:MAG: ABC transporter permease [Caulobacterales bacterium]|nr:ABC transporter permease [Caulobacterales bacterium]
MLSVLRTELTKLNRSLALLLALAAPGLVGLFLLLNGLRDGQQLPWEIWLATGSGIWAFFMLPMSVTALTALVGQAEHAPRAWDHLRTLPVPRWWIYGAKAVMVLTVVALMSALTLALAVTAGGLVGVLRPGNAPTGSLDVLTAAGLMMRIALASVLMIAIQFFLAVRFASFVPGLVLGIAGTFFSVVATSSRIGVFLPWQMPVNIMASDSWRAQTALGLGLGLGLVALGLSVAILARRDVA